MKHGKKYQEAVKKYDKAKIYTISEAAGLVKELSYAKFDETVELHIKLMLKKSQSVRDTVVLPNQFSCDCMSDEPGVDLIDNLHVPGQDLLHHGDGPLLKCLRHECVVGVTHTLLGDVPCGIPVKAFLVDEDPHELGDGD